MSAEFRGHIHDIIEYSGSYRAAEMERHRAHIKHDDKGNSMERKAWDDPAWLPVVVEEIGEIARALCDKSPRAHLLSEVTQSMAMLSAWYDAILEDRVHGRMVPDGVLGRQWLP